MLGGVEVPFDRGLLGHSDGDVVSHALCDALLGAAGAGDIGTHFPDSDPQYEGADSTGLLAQVRAILTERGFVVGNVDVTVLAERPRLAPYVDAMRRHLAATLGVDPAQVSVKAKTSEGQDAVGRGDAIAAIAVALVEERGRVYSAQD